MVQASGLKAVSMHIDNTLMGKGADEMSRVVDQLKNWGFQYAVYPYVPQNERGGADAMKAFAEKLNRFGEKCHAAGIQFAYHNHAFESAPVGNQTLFQILIDSTDKKLVGFELDCFWLSRGRQRSGGIHPEAERPRAPAALQGHGAGHGAPLQRIGAAHRVQRGWQGVLDWPAILRRRGRRRRETLLRRAGPDPRRSARQLAAKL
jgi:sugar phosphate isomerase/epimerase